MNKEYNKKLNFEAQIVNFGCKLNQFEGESLKEALNGIGIDSRIVHPSELNNKNDINIIYIINTCTVTSKSDRKARNAIYKAASLKKDGDLLIVTGCYAQTDREELAKMRNIDFIIGNYRKALIPEIIRKGNNLKVDNIEENKLVFSYIYPIKQNRARAYVKVQDGCSMRCSYCKIPMARGKSVSRPLEDIIYYVKRLEDADYHEIVLTGINLGSYSFNGISLGGLISRILENTNTIGVRLSSIEPMYFKDDLFDVLTDDRVMPHFHVPMQSGSNRILNLMRRPYSIESFIKIIEKLRNIKRDTPHLATDVIVGFPTESIKEYEDSYQIIKSLEFSSIHVFTYSPRKGTEAAKMKEDVSSEEKKQRSHALIELGKSLNYKYRLMFLNNYREAIFEKHDENWIGVTDNYIKVTIVNNHSNNLSKEKLTVYITQVNPSTTLAEIV